MSVPCAKLRKTWVKPTVQNENWFSSPRTVASSSSSGIVILSSSSWGGASRHGTVTRRKGEL